VVVEMREIAFLVALVAGILELAVATVATGVTWAAEAQEAMLVTAVMVATQAVVAEPLVQAAVVAVVRANNVLIMAGMAAV
jgi:uncharacterized membrane protein